jgi:hypothetical protein
MSIGRFIESPYASSIIGHKSEPLPVGRIISEAPCVANAKPLQVVACAGRRQLIACYRIGPAMRYTSLEPDAKLLSDRRSAKDLPARRYAEPSGPTLVASRRYGSA